MSDTIQGVKTIDVRLIHTHGTEAEWATKSSFVPAKGELIVYDADETHTYARHKIGDGVTKLIDLPFLNKLTPGRGIEITDDHTITFAHPEILDAASMVGISSVGNTTTHNIATKSDFNTFKEEVTTQLDDKVSVPPVHNDSSPTYVVGSEINRFKGLYVDEIHSKAGNWFTSITPYFSAWGPGYKTDHLTVSTLEIDGHNNGDSPAMFFGNIFCVPWESNGIELYGNFKCENFEADKFTSYVDGVATSITPQLSALGPGYTMDHLTVSSLFITGHNNDNMPILTFGNCILTHWIDNSWGNNGWSLEGNFKCNNLKAGIISGGILQEDGVNLEDKYALKDEVFTKIKYADLVSLRDNAQLKPGAFYRITDYICTTTQTNTSSAGHQFDIIVRADSESILNENAWATYHYNEDGSVDGYFQAVEKAIISASLVDGTEMADIPVIFTESYNESYVSLQNAWGEQTHFDIYEHPKWAIDVPVVYDPDPEESGSDYIYFYEDSITRPVGNSLVSIEAIMDPTGEEVLYSGSHNTSGFDDVLVDFDYQANTPVMRKTEAFLYESTDTDELLVYNGDITLDGTTYNQWNKLETADSVVYIILTNKIVENGKFIYSLDELRNAVIYESLDKWGEYYANTMEFNGYYRYTRNVVNAEFNELAIINANLAAWELKYCLDNDKNRFYWANENGGHGVIYYMRDEYNNECGYDFKNILFSGLYTFHWNAAVPLDLSIFGNNGSIVNDEGHVLGVYNNVIKPHYEADVNAISQKLNKIVFDEDSNWDNGWFYGCYDNQFDYNCFNIYFENHCINNIFGKNCKNNTFGLGCKNNTFGNNCTNNTFGNWCSGNTFRDSCYENNFGDNCSNIEVSHSCYIDLYSQSTNAIIEYVKGNVHSHKNIQLNYRTNLTIVRPANVEEVLV